MPEQEKPATVRIDLTEDQARRLEVALGQGRIVAQGAAIEMSIEELETRILPRITLN